jgi:hypothetical protein
LRLVPPTLLLLAILLWDGGGPSALAFGGSGGTMFRITCRSNGILIGLSAFYGDWMDGVGLLCRTISIDGDLGDEYASASVGGPGGRIHTQARCPEGTVVAGLGGGYGLYVNSILVRCQRWDSRTKGMSRGAGIVITLAGLQSAPHEGDRKICPPNEVAFGLSGKAGAYLDSVELICSPR